MRAGLAKFLGHIRTQLLLPLVLFELVALVIVGSAAVTIYRNQLVQAAHLQQEIARSGSQSVKTHLDRLQTILSNVGQYEDLMHLTEEERKRVLFRLQNDQSAFVALAITDRAGRVLTRRESRPDIAPLTIFWGEHEALATILEADVYVGSLHFYDRIPYILMAVPVFNPQLRVAGMLVAEVDLTSLWDVIVPIGADPSGYAYVVDDDGILIAARDLNLVKDLVNLNHIAGVQAAQAGRQPAGVYDGLMERPVIGGSAAIDGVHWWVIAELDQGAVLSPLRSLLILLIVQVGVSIVLAFLVWFYINKRIARPIVEITRGARLIGEGDLDHRVVVASQGELSNLAYVLNSSAAQIKGLVANLEQRVQERKQAQEALQRYASRLEKLRQIDRAVLSMDAIDEIVQTSLKHLRTLLGCKRTSVLMFNFERNVARIVAMDTDVSTRLSEGQEFSLDKFRISEELRQGKAFWVEDFRKQQDLFEIERLLLEEGVTSYLNTPLMVEGKLVGSLNVGAERPELVTAEYIDIAQEVAMMLSIANQQAYLNQRVQQYTAELEKRVHERTAQLEAANKEMEAFSYSVSHDLRAPLRAIDGFSQALAEDYAEKLDGPARHDIGRIRAAAQRMSELIDALLKLSRVSRSEVQKTQVDLSGLATDVIEDLRAAHPGRIVEFICPPSLIVEADPTLIRIVLVNLLGNAWKFTSQHPTALIELGGMLEDGVRALFVRDDGAGFDMTYGAKLFGAFQRLHKAGDFDGTGIGLAMVQRIVARHGGRIWAESAVEQGATFYFTLQ